MKVTEKCRFIQILVALANMICNKKTARWKADEKVHCVLAFTRKNWFDIKKYLRFNKSISSVYQNRNGSRSHWTRNELSRKTRISRIGSGSRERTKQPIKAKCIESKDSLLSLFQFTSFDIKQMHKNGHSLQYIRSMLGLLLDDLDIYARYVEKLTNATGLYKRAYFDFCICKINEIQKVHPRQINDQTIPQTISDKQKWQNLEKQTDIATDAEMQRILEVSRTEYAEIEAFKTLSLKYDKNIKVFQLR